MAFELTPEEAQRPALAVIRHFRQRRIEMKIEKSAWPDAPYRTTLFGAQAGLITLIEAQGILAYSGTLKGLATWLAARRYYVELFIATMHDSSLQASAIDEIRRDGVGLMIVDDDGTVRTAINARNPALVVTPEPTLRYGVYQTEIRESLRKFNETDRRDGLRDMCELVERITAEVGVAACRKKWLKIPEPQFREMDWSTQINQLARPEVYLGGHAPILRGPLKDDLHSFRGARNLVDHPAHGRREAKRRQMQFAERMLQGPRLVAELVAAKRRIR